MTNRSDCPGHVGRGTGEQCGICHGTIPADLRRKPGDPVEWSASCRGCVNGAPHVHPLPRWTFTGKG